MPIHLTHWDEGESLVVERLGAHELKCWPQFFSAICEGRKRHDLRRTTDRNFRVGDTVRLLEFDPQTNDYTGRQIQVQITYITSAELPCALSDQALHPDFCILSIEVDGREK